MPREKLLEISAKGGAACPAEKRSFSKDSALAADAGREGGRISRKRRSSVGEVPDGVSDLSE
jgi:general stress protein YciG